MTCTTYNDSIGYSAAIPYNGTCVSPNPPMGMGGFSDFFAQPFPPIDDDEGLVIALLGLLEDDY